MATSEGESPSMAEDQENVVPQKEAVEFVLECGVRCLGKVNGKWFQGQVTHVKTNGKEALFRVDRSAIGRVNFVDVNNDFLWLPATDFHPLEADPTDGCEIKRAKTWEEQEPPLKKKNLDYQYGSSQSSSNYGGSHSSYSSWSVPNERASCGFAGLKNQGATCYLNSLLQSYYMTPRLREALFRYRFDEENTKITKEQCVPYQLQRLFAHLQLCKQQATDTRGLTDSFGWKAEDVYQQHDVVELATILLSHLEERTKDEDLINIVKEYKVATADYVKCLTCGHRSERPDVMGAVQLNIENVISIEESLANFCKPETLDGDNKYMCSKCNSKQPAKKGIRFTKFKDFVAFQLNRWMLDFNTFERKKIRDKIHFPFRINMSKYLPDEGAEDIEDGGEANSQPKSSIVWKLSFEGVKDPEPLMKDFEFAVAHTVGTNEDAVTVSVLDTNDDGLCVLNVDVHSRDPSSVSTIIQGKEAFASRFMRNVQTHAGDRGVDLDDSLQLTEVGDTTVTELKQEYELYSMMIHRGGAYGGHYFAYIKHPTEDRYFVFNDSRVEEIEPDELAEMFDENCPKPKHDSPLSGAYMLLYRRVGCDVPTGSEELIPKEIREEIDKANAEFEKKIADRKARDLEVNIQVHYKDKKEKVKMAKTDKLKEALAKIREELKVEADIDDEDLRLRFYDRQQPRTPLADETKTLADWNIRSHSTQFYLEQREKGEQFPDYQPQLKTIHLKIVNSDAEYFCFREERDIDVIKRGTIGDLRKQIADVLTVEEKKVKLWRKKPSNPLPMALDDNKNTLVQISKRFVL
jgi:ubiquitin carboxyl-terminal hydrolase 47